MSADEIARDRLRSFVERIERLEEEKKAITDDIKDVYAEAKGNGYNTKVLRRVVALRRMDKAEREEFEAVLDLYMEALGMLADTQLGGAAVERQTSPAEPVKSDRKKAPADTMRIAVDVMRRLGDPVPLTETEQAKGGIFALKQRDGTRITVSIPDREVRP